MTLFPLAAAVTIVLNGHPVSGYARAYLSEGHIVAPLRPYITRLADRMWFENGLLIVRRGDRTVRLRVAGRMPDALDSAYIPLASVTVSLGVRLVYHPNGRLVELSTSQPEIVSPPPFDPSAPHVVPTVVFTPAPSATPRPTWSGPAIPRRTPVPYASPASRR